MVIGHHLVWTVYGWWLPNDLRGSWSQEIRVEKLKEMGEIHLGRKAVQPRYQQVQRFNRAAQDLLYHEVLEFTDPEIEVVAKAIGDVIRKSGYTCYAAAIMPEHVHLLIRRHRDMAEVMLERFQDATKLAVHDATIRPRHHPVWGGPGWKRFQSSVEQLTRTIEYIRRNPIKAGRAEQTWDFVTTYDGWAPPGGAMNVPAARRERET